MARVVIPHVPFHVTQRGVNREVVFRDEADYRRYLDMFTANVRSAGVRVIAFCLMPNHVHWLVTPERENSLSTLFRKVHGRYALDFNQRNQRVGHLWQARYFSCPMDRQHLLAAIQYVEWNPVEAGLASTAADYQFSSAGAHVEGVSSGGGGLLDWTFWEEMGGCRGWRKLIENPVDARFGHALIRCSKSGAPLGDQTFQAFVEQQSGIAHRK